MQHALQQRTATTNYNNTLQQYTPI